MPTATRGSGRSERQDSDASEPGERRQGQPAPNEQDEDRARARGGLRRWASFVRRVRNGLDGRQHELDHRHDHDGDRRDYDDGLDDVGRYDDVDGRRYDYDELDVDRHDHHGDYDDDPAAPADLQPEDRERPGR